MLEPLAQPADTAALSSETSEKTRTRIFQLGKAKVQFDVTGALWLPAEKTLVFSDLHFGQGTSYGRRGLFLPPYDTRRTLATMAQIMAHYHPHRVISLGDAFYDVGAEARMDKADADLLAHLTGQTEWIWVLGNHDPAPPARFAGRSCDHIILAGLHFTPTPHLGGEWHVAGHLHPCARVSRAGRNIRRRCFVTDGKRLILPAFGAYTGGLNILDTAFQGLFSVDMTVHMLGEGAVWQVPARALQADGGRAFALH